jgi:NADH dehydrogenase/NADH:ubiquinone oxidoreductase subunit G
MTGPIMSSKESYAEKRTSLIFYVEDQITNGVYKTTQREVKSKDPITGVEKTVTIVEIMKNADGSFSRQEEAILKSYGIRTSNFAVTGLPYDETVEKQITQQQELTMKVQTAMASAKEAEQRAITVAKEGEANAAAAKWSQEVEKAKAVVSAQQKLEVMTLDAKAAAQEKQANILRGEGEATRKKLVMAADGALDPKLQKWSEVNLAYAKAIAEYKGNWVPTIIMGGEGKSGSGAQNLIEMLQAKTAKELALDMSLSGKDNTR